MPISEMEEEKRKNNDRRRQKMRAEIFIHVRIIRIHIYYIYVHIASMRFENIPFFLSVGYDDFATKKSWPLNVAKR